MQPNAVLKVRGFQITFSDEQLKVEPQSKTSPTAIASAIPTQANSGSSNLLGTPAIKSWSCERVRDNEFGVERQELGS